MTKAYSRFLVALFCLFLGGLLRRRAAVECPGRLPPAELRGHLPGPDRGLYHAGEDRLGPSAGEGAEGADARPDGVVPCGLYRLSGGWQL